MWREIAAVYRKEMRTYFVSAIPYFVIGFFAIIMAHQFFIKPETAFFIYDKAEMYRGFFFEFEHILVPLVAVISMRVWSSEYSAGTIETLITLPVRTGSLVIGKFLGGWTLVLVCFLATAAIPITVSSSAAPCWPWGAGSPP